MSHARIGVLIGLLFALGISAYFFYNLLETNEGVNSSVEYFEEGSYKDAVIELNQNRSEMSSAQYQLFLAYIARGRNELVESSIQLAKAEEISDSKKKPEVLMEIYLNQALNAFISRDPQGIEEALAKARKLASVNQDWIPLFEGIKDYLKHQCGEAQKNWQKPIPQVYFSPYMKSVFSKQFTTSWLKGHMARCEIESGNYLNIRQGLESGHQEDAETNFLTAMTYIKEASEKSPKGAIPYYKIAFSYLNKVSLNDPAYVTDRQQIMSDLGKKALQLVRERSFQELGFYAEILEKSKATGELNQISQALAEELNKEIDVGNWKQVSEIVDLLSKSIGQGGMRDKLRERFEKLLNQALDGGDLSHVEFYWKTIRSFADDSNQLSDQFADMAAAKIFVLIPFDDDKLTISQPYFSFWKTVEKDHVKRLQFANQLAVATEQLWNKEGQEQKAISLMKMAYSIPFPTDQKAFYNKLENMLAALWKRASEADVVDQYPYYLQAVNHFGFTHVNVLDTQEASQQLVDAEYMYKNARYEDAKKRALWALQVDPRDQKAKKIAGLSEYYLGDYTHALEYLSGIPNDSEVETALAVSQLLTGNKVQGDLLLQQLKSKGQINSKDFLRIAFGLLQINQPEASVKWFDQSSMPNEGVKLAGRMYVNYSLKQYQQVVDGYAALEYPYSRLDGLQAITIQSLIALQRFDAAEELLLNLLKKDSQPETNEFPLYFRGFKTAKLDEFSRYYLAAKFYSEIRNNPKRAIAYFQQIKEKSPEILYDYSQALEDNGNLQESFRILQALDSTNNLSPEIQKQVVLGLAKAYELMPDRIQALNYYQKYLQLVPDDTKARLEYSKILASVRRYDLALQQLQESKAKEPLLSAEWLIRQGKYTEAINNASDWLNQSQPDLTQQLELAAIFLKAPNFTISNSLAKQIKEPSKLTLDQKEALIDFWMAKGEYPKALELIKSNKVALQKRATGLLTLAYYANKASAPEEALSYAQKAAEMYPKNLEVKEFIDENAVPTKESLKETSNEPSKQLSQAKALLRYAASQFAAKKITSLHNSVEVAQASNMLSELSRAYPQLPEIWFNYGIALFQLRRFVDADVALNNAIRLDPSYAIAHAVLANVYSAQNQLTKATDEARQALKIDPFLSEAWEALGSIHEQQGMLLDAATEYQNAVKFRPNSVSALVKYGKIRLKASDPEQAIESFEQALLYAPNDTNLLKLTIVTYNDSDLKRDRPSSQLKTKQQALFKKLEELDPKEAETVKSDLLP